MILTAYPPFRPEPWMRDPHLQTVASYWLRPRETPPPGRRFLVTLPDQDRLVIHDNQPSSWITGDRIVILVHGLCGSHRSPYMQRTTVKLLRAGLRVIRVDLRGWGDSRLLSKGHAHAGSTSDLAAVLRGVGQLSPISKVTLVGFSLGGNLVLKLAGEWGAHPPAEVDSLLAVSPPIDLAWASSHLRQWGNRLYDWFFISRLRGNLIGRRKQVAGLVDNGLHPLPRRLVHFDDQFLAPVNGFAGARDYYAQASAAPDLAGIQLPSLIVTAADDPVVPVVMFSNWPLSTATELLVLPRGGHLGFLNTGRFDPDPYWLDWRLAEWISRL